MQKRVPDKSARGIRDENEKKGSGIEDSGLAICDKGSSAELIGAPERESAGPNRFACKLSPGVKLTDSVPTQGVPGRQVRVERCLFPGRYVP